RQWRAIEEPPILERCRSLGHDGKAGAVSLHCAHARRPGHDGERLGSRAFSARARQKNGLNFATRKGAAVEAQFIEHTEEADALKRAREPGADLKIVTGLRRETSQDLLRLQDS